MISTNFLCGSPNCREIQTTNRLSSSQMIFRLYSKALRLRHRATIPCFKWAKRMGPAVWCVFIRNRIKRCPWWKRMKSKLLSMSEFLSNVECPQINALNDKMFAQLPDGLLNSWNCAKNLRGSRYSRIKALQWDARTRIHTVKFGRVHSCRTNRVSKSFI